MDTPNSSIENAALRDYLAIERTSLAWIRTGLALMGFGFVVSRFGLFLAEFRIALSQSGPPSHQFSLWSGTALIATGVAVNLYSAWRHVQLVEDLNHGRIARQYSSKQAVIVALFLALVGSAMAVYLTFIRASG